MRRRTQEVDQMGNPQKIVLVEGEETVVPTNREYNGEDIQLNTDNVVLIQTLTNLDAGYYRVVTLINDFLVDETDKDAILSAGA